MSRRVVEFPDRAATEQEAAAWLVRLDGDDPPSADELESLRQWLARSPAHREQLTALAELWDTMNVLTELSVPINHPARATRRRAAPRVPRKSPSMRWLGLAAAALCVLAVNLFWLRTDPLLDSNGFYSTAVGQRESTTLADGSVVMLNTNSQIKVQFDGEYRDVRLLQGEAHFTVASNRDRPFRVYAGDRRVQAVGTTFSVHLKDNALDVTVTEGKVMLSSAVSAVTSSPQRPSPVRSPSAGANPAAAVGELLFEENGTIAAGQSVTLSEGVANFSGGLVTLPGPEVAKRLSWRSGILTFTGDRLEDVVREISRYTTISIEIVDPAVRDRPIGGRFPIGETERMFQYLEVNFGLQVTQLGHDRVLISASSEQ